MKKIFITGLVVAFFQAFTWASALSDLAASMQSKTWAQLSTQGLTGVMTGYTTGCSSSLIEYADNGVWDPVHQKFLFLGAPHYCWPWKFIVYEAATNQWTNGPLPASGMETGGSTIGHGYDHNAVDPTTGDVYHKPYNSRTVYRYSSGSWSTFSVIPTSVMPSVGITGGLTYFPELNGLIYIQGADGGVYFCNTSTNQWSRITQGLAMGSYSNLIEYDCVHKRVYFGGGGTSDFYSLDTAKNVVKKANAPISYANSNGGASLAIDPVTGTLFLFSYEGSGRYEYNPSTNQWSTFTGVTPPFSFNFNNINTPVSTYGVTMFVTKSTVYLYKHASGTGVRHLPEDAPVVDIHVSPNPFHSPVDISIKGKFQVSSCNLSLFDIKGKQLRTWNLKLETAGNVSWDASGLPTGVYLLRAKWGKQTIVKRLFLQK